ncbi:hypothetical protein F4861DRAFT_167301 [Xylaria intraflava]|nr:hypothetical protein F4861DRAFT_167301 [Xylaria intraflava]
MSANATRSPLLTQPTRAAEGGPQTVTTDFRSPGAAPATDMPKSNQISTPPIGTPPHKVDTEISWGTPVGLPIRSNNDENLVIFRRALGINTHKTSADDSGTLEEGRTTAMGMYRHVIEMQTRKRVQHGLLQAFLYLVYFAQIIIGAALTALGATASQYQTAITVLGVINTVLAGVLALIKGSGQPQRLGKDRIGYRRLQDWIEETEALLAVGVIGRNSREVGLLVESAFKRYNAAKASEENNDPEYYVFHRQEGMGYRPGDAGIHGNRNAHEAIKTLGVVPRN